MLQIAAAIITSCQYTNRNQYRFELFYILISSFASFVNFVIAAEITQQHI
jgi:hypothetical protein